MKAVDGALHERVRSEQTKPLDVAAAAEALARTPDGRKQLARLVAPHENLWRAQIAWNDAEALFRLDVAAVALVAYCFKSHRYPPSLEALGSDLLPGRFSPSEPSPGYVMSYRSTPSGAGASAYALTAAPEEKEATGNRAFCLDSTGTTRFTTDGKAPKIVGGLCDPQARLLR